MTDITNTNQNKQDKLIALFKFIEELNKVRNREILNISEYRWYKPLTYFNNDKENIKIYYKDKIEEEKNNNDILLTVHKPNLQSCPKPDNQLLKWLEEGWDDDRKELKIKKSIEKNKININITKSSLNKEVEEATTPLIELFTDNKERIEIFNIWKEQRENWAQKQKILRKTRSIFSELYKLYIDLNRESETLELIVANGFIKCKDEPQINHPILTRRVQIYHDAEKNTILIKDSDVETQIYTSIFQNIKDINLNAINHIQNDLHENDYHPLDRNDLPLFLKIFTHQLSAKSIYSENGIPEGWEKRENILIYQNPCYILRNRKDGTIKAIEQIIDNIEETNEVPNPIKDIIEGGTIDIVQENKENTIEEQLAAVGGESIDILLSKEANKEQLEIAQRIEQYNAVLVQGPPGTGKTHTIANLMGHFLAQGKSVLVTSHTKKALSVLKEKVNKNLQNLCVSMLDDSNIDMEKSIDGIIEYMSSTNSLKLSKEMNLLKEERVKIIKDLSMIRKKIFNIINKECNSIVYNGEEISLSKMAQYVHDNMNNLSYIPGTAKLYSPLPLSLEELKELYETNITLSTEDENEFAQNIPTPQEIPTPNELKENYNKLNKATAHLKSIISNNKFDIKISTKEKKIMINDVTNNYILNYPSEDNVNELKDYINSLPKLEEWMKHCATDGKRGGAYKQIWHNLIDKINETSNFSEELVTKQFGKEVKILNNNPQYPDAVRELLSKYNQNNKIGKLSFILNKNLEIALNGATINNKKPENANDCKLILDIIYIKNLRNECAIYWDNLIKKYGVPAFKDLDINEPEHIAAKYIPTIQRYLDWFTNEYEILLNKITNINIPHNIIFKYDTFDSEIVESEKILYAIQHTIPDICNAFETIETATKIKTKFDETINILNKDKRKYSQLCKNITKALKKHNIEDYKTSYNLLVETYEKNNIIIKRKEYLKKLAIIAPQWAKSIEKREGIHGEGSIPNNIEDAWKWKQYYEIINETLKEPFAQLQKKSILLSKKYREKTAEYAEKSAWYNLLYKIERDIDMTQALIGWKQTIKRIGKGTGKNAPKYRAEARILMAKCQNAVPGWIMTINKALESLNPKKNRFDIIIIDEASQSDISSLAILYMGKKLIIVGDDKQVSPMAIGANIEKMNNLREMYINGKIPNAHLYDGKTSIYDIAATTFKPLMLHEHFRCTPEIIGFSNWLSYDFKIKPLRDCSNNELLPSVINYRVANGQRINKTNPNEAKTIVALMQACMEQPEYKSKTFGIISLLGDEQVNILQEEIFKRIDPKEQSKRKILCGNASNFQGDERDVIFLSLVDCANGEGPLSKVGFGIDDSTRKRYNVATSRAKDQLWVVHSIDSANDLKQGDIRKMLIEYSMNPKKFEVQNSKIEKNSESPFEEEVAKFLSVRGYHIVQQWEVGAYRIDMIAICGKRKIAIECDGELYHSGEEKIREDMERQTILERLGWKFIRIRGSEYYLNKEKTMQKVISELKENGIEPEEYDITKLSDNKDTKLLQKIKGRANEILNEYKKDENSELDQHIVATALNSQKDIENLNIFNYKNF